LLGETNLGRMDKSKVVLDYKFEYSNRELDELLPAEEEHRGCLK
jgi:hypothetical protein